ncbi:putative membrane protein [Chelatococcus caeni]|uniref:Putative membrane protein n=1 Tax=Chelatococcus caeni TaxID=1348468 RepID=A0A840BTE2_9HYPH|nr:NnrU family protein [Chelatococcus caeni]MBB4015853.1 putative membrane protein [Chelatococcus caeni]
MTLLIIGLAIFFAAHVFTMYRGPRAAAVARLGEGGYKALYSLASLIGLVLIVWGFGRYRAEGYIPLWEPPLWGRHLALALMWPVFVLLVAAYAPGAIKRKVRHPMLAAVKIWALAHLLANGDLGSLLLFGSFLAWAVADRIAVKRRPGSDAAVPAGSLRNDVVAVVAGTIVYVAFLFWLHPLLIGVPVLPA